MPLRVIILAVISVCFIAISPLALAQDFTLPAVTIDNLNLKSTIANANSFTGSLSVTNHENYIVSGVSFEYRLLQGDNLYDVRHVYPHLVLEPGASQPYNIIYTPPRLPTGDYQLRIQAQLLNGQPLATQNLPLSLTYGVLPVFLSLDRADSTDPVALVPASEFTLPLTINNPREEAFTGAVSATATRLFHTLSAPSSSTSQISIPPASSQTVNLSFAAPDQPGQYLARLHLLDPANSLVSDQLEYSFQVTGPAASIKDVRLDSLPTADRQSATITTFITGGVADQVLNPLKTQIQLLDGNHVVGESTEVITALVGPLELNNQLTLTDDISGYPRLRVNLIAPDDSIVDQYTINLSSAPIKPIDIKQANRWLVYAIVFDAIVLLLTGLVIVRSHRQSSPPKITPLDSK